MQPEKNGSLARNSPQAFHPTATCTSSSEGINVTLVPLYLVLHAVAGGPCPPHEEPPVHRRGRVRMITRGAHLCGLRRAWCLRRAWYYRCGGALRDGGPDLLRLAGGDPGPGGGKRPPSFWG